jgi:hypothetical protein
MSPAAAANEVAQAQDDAQAVDDEEALLQRIVDLEALVAADLARKPKHQKPALREAWERELAGLKARCFGD